MVANFRTLLFTLLILCFTTNIICKIVLPHKLRYLENMLNSEVVAKAAKIRQRIEENPNLQDSEKSWPLLLAKYQDDKKPGQSAFSYNNNNIFGRRNANFK